VPILVDDDQCLWSCFLGVPMQSNERYSLADRSLQDAPHLPSIPDPDELKSAMKHHACNDGSLKLVGFCCD
jgi:hypothetical protein